jgi:putative transposase
MDIKFKKHNDNELTYGRGSVYTLQYHLVWCTKYRKGVLVGNIAEEIQASLKTTAEELGIAIDVMEVMPDHIHLLIDCKPQCRLSDAVKVFKGNTARWLFMEHPELKKELWGGHLWNPSYFVVTVSERSSEQVRRYIEEQRTK